VKAIITHPTKVDGNSTLASINIAKFLAETLGLDIKDRSTGKAEKNDVILMVNGPPAFCNWREEMAEMVRKAKTFVFIQNDYTIAPPSQVGKVMRKKGWMDDRGVLRPPIVWGTVEHKLRTPESAYVNWNALPFERFKTFVQHRYREPGLFYYGAFREGRKADLEKYLASTSYEVTTSSSAQAKKKFLGLDKKINALGPMRNLLQDLQHYRATVYMEDEYSHRYYCSPANRFYECLAAKVAQFIDEEAAPTLMRAGFDVKDFIVAGPKDVEKFLPKSKLIAEIQYERFAKDFRSQLKKRVKKLYKQLERRI